MMKLLLLLLAIPGFLSAQSPGAPVPAQTTALVGCPSVEGYDAQVQAAMSGDPLVWLDAMELWGCRQVAPGTPVVVIPVEARADVLCVQTMLRLELGGWIACLFVDAAQVRRNL